MIVVGALHWHPPRWPVRNGATPTETALAVASPDQMATPSTARTRSLPNAADRASVAVANAERGRITDAGGLYIF
jgi:hypothetical protein